MPVDRRSSPRTATCPGSMPPCRRDRWGTRRGSTGSTRRAGRWPRAVFARGAVSRGSVGPKSVTVGTRRAAARCATPVSPLTRHDSRARSAAAAPGDRVRRETGADSPRLGDGEGRLVAFRRAEQERAEPVPIEERREAAEGLSRPTLGRSERRAQMEPDHASARAHTDVREQRVDLRFDRGLADRRRHAGTASSSTAIPEALDQEAVLVDLMAAR